MTLRRQQHALYLVACVCAAAAVLTLGLSVGLPLDSGQPAATAALAALPITTDSAGDNLPARSSFEPLLALPLRRPLYDAAPVVEAPKPKVIPPLRLTLLGTILEPDQALAVLRDSGGKTQFLEVGQSLEDATVLTIEAAAVSLEYHGETRTLSTDPNHPGHPGHPGSPGSGSAPGSAAGDVGGRSSRNR